MKAWTEGQKIPLLIAKEPLWNLTRSLSTFCFHIFKSQEIVWEPGTETMSPSLPTGEGWDFYLSISTLTTHNTGRKHLEEPENGRMQLVIQFPKLMQSQDNTGLKALKMPRLTWRSSHHFGDALRPLLPLEIPAEPSVSSHWLPAKMHK